MTFSVVFKLEDGVKEIDDVLTSNGAYNEGDQWRMLIGNGEIYFFEYAGRFVVSNLSLEEYSRLYRHKKLADDPAFSYMISSFPKEDISRGFLDIGDIIEKLVGLKVNSKMVFYQTYENGVFLYRVEVM